MAEPLQDTAPAIGRATAATAGARLRSAREAAGLTVDVVAQQLKLAPRQVKALEDDDWSRLPGRTFARGFARNYARFVRLDPDTVLALMPESEGEPALERPTLTGSRRPIGEIPLDRAAKPSAARFAIPLVVLAIVALVVYREIVHADFRHGDFGLSALTSLLRRTPAPSESTREPAPAAKAPSAISAPRKPIAETSASAAAPTSVSASAATNVTVLNTQAPESTDANAPAAMPAQAEQPPVPPTEAPLVLTFKGTSWAEVKDAKGRVVLQLTGGPGMTQTVTALPPLELLLGNAPDVRVTFRGQSLDLSPYTRGNVARVSLK